MLVHRQGVLLQLELGAGLLVQPGVCVAEMQKNLKSHSMQYQKQQYQKILFYVLGLMFWVFSYHLPVLVIVSMQFVMRLLWELGG